MLARKDVLIFIRGIPFELLNGAARRNFEPAWTIHDNLIMAQEMFICQSFVRTNFLLKYFHMLPALNARKDRAEYERGYECGQLGSHNHKQHVWFNDRCDGRDHQCNILD